MNRLHYDFPSARWEEALPIGNGRLGAMIYGNVSEDQLQLNEISVWSGEPQPNADRPDAYKHLPTLRKMIDEQKYKEAGELLDREFTNAGGGFDAAYFSSYQTLGDLFIEQHDKSVIFTDYYRYLDIETAVSGVEYTVNGVRYKREYFASAPANVVICRFTASQTGKIDLNIALNRNLAVVYAENNDLVMRGQTENAPGDTSRGIIFEARLHAICKGGNVKALRGSMKIESADEATLFFAARTNYRLDQKNGYRGKDPHEDVCKDIEKASECCYETLKDEHIADYRAFYAANSIHFDGDDHSDMLTHDRLKRYNEGYDDVGLIELFYQYGRYLLICSSRPSNELPANLQGLWCKDYEAPWHCDYHANINVQMNYWPAGPTNIVQCTRPFANLIKGLAANGRKTAKAYYNSDGWTVYTITNPFGWTSPGWGGGWSQYPLGGAWMVQHLCEYYAFTQDKTLLEEFWPYIKENCLFNMNILVKDDDGSFVTSPATSPENSFKDDSGNIGWVCKGTAMDIEMLWENFTYVIRCCNILDRDFELRDKLIELRSKLKKLRIGKAGQLCEWYGDWDLNAPEIHHRHTSHLYGLHPGTMISAIKTPELAAAAKKTLDIRGDDGTGWSLAWKINFWARLREGDRAYKLLKNQLRTVSDRGYNYSNGGGVYLNLFDAHPPFQIDGNFGATAGISEMFLQSHAVTDSDEYIIDILPAVPSTLSSGEIKGLLARGGFEADITWKDKRATSVIIRSLAGNRCAVYGNVTVTKNGKAVDSECLNNITVFNTVKGSEYEIIF